MHHGYSADLYENEEKNKIPVTKINKKKDGKLLYNDSIPFFLPLHTHHIQGISHYDQPSPSSVRRYEFLRHNLIIIFHKLLID